jgi:acetolactate synthase regulatory subunit
MAGLDPAIQTNGLKKEPTMNAIAALSPYSSSAGKANHERHTLSVLVDNEPGVLARVVGLFSGRGYNIESLTVAEVAHVERWSRITIVTTGSPAAIEQISHQLERIVPTAPAEVLRAVPVDEEFIVDDDEVVE